MSNEEYLIRMKEAKEAAGNGVDYSPQFGAVCPFCKTPRAHVRASLPWENNMKIRYHLCANRQCPMQQLNITIKSIQEDSTGVGRSL
ncbi:MAG: hypothetical protein P8130_15830 [Deltaproteobacteria bacterium]